MIFDAIITDRSTASWRICCSARCGLELNLALRVPDDAVGLGPRLLPHLFPQPLGVRLGSARSIGLRLDAGLPDDLRRFLLQPLQLLLGLLRVVQRLSDRLLTAVERLQQRPPRELRQQRQQDQKREDCPDEQSGSGWTSGLSHCAPPSDAQLV